MQTGDVPLQGGQRLRGQQPGCSSAAGLPKIVAHRGASHAAPENTLPAIRLAFEEGADLVEGDYWLIREERIVWLHGAKTMRNDHQQPSRRVHVRTLAE